MRSALLLCALTAVACSTTPAKPDQATTTPAAATAAPAPAESCGGPEAMHAAAPVDGSVQTAFDAAPAVGTKVRCPVSGEVFTVTEATARAEYNGKHYAFCCPGCKGRFEANPAAFVGK